MPLRHDPLRHDDEDNARLAIAVVNTVAPAALRRGRQSSLMVSGRPAVLALPRPTNDAIARLTRLQAKSSAMRSASTLPMGPAAANAVVQVPTNDGPVVVKTRVDPKDPIDEEVWALCHAPPEVVPALVAAASHEALVATAIEHGAFAEAAALERLPTQSLLMDAVKGTAPSVNDEGALERIAQALAIFHQARPAKGPPIRAGRSLAACVRLCLRLTRALSDASVVDKGAAKSIEGMLRRWQKRADALLETHRIPPSLCHGDLRLHNVLDDKKRVVLIDLEHAGLSDPALDIALFRARTPLSTNAELTFLDAYLEESFRIGSKQQSAFLERYALARPIALALSGLAAGVDVLDVIEGRRRTGEKIDAFVDDKRHACAEDLSAAFGLPIEPAFPSPPSKETRPSRSATKTSKAKKDRAAQAGIRIALDGTAASGKSVLAKAAAQRLRLPWRNTGAVFRLFALRALELELQPCQDDDAVHERVAARVVRSFKGEALALTDDGAVTRNGERIELALEVWPVEQCVAQWARAAATRAFLAPLLAQATSGAAIVEGRAVTSELWPNADVRLFVDASADVRAKRTHGRLWQPPALSVVKRTLNERDKSDRKRTRSPLVHRPDVPLIDTTRASERKSIDDMLALIDAAAAGRRR